MSRIASCETFDIHPSEADNIYFANTINTNNNNNKEYLQCFQWDFNNENKKKEIEDAIKEISKKIQPKMKKQIEEEILNNNITEIINKYDNYYSYYIGPICNINLLIKIKFSEDINFNYSEIQNLDKSNLSIYKFRNISGDGNCFYRGVIFYFLENIIISNNILLMKEFLKLYNQKSNVENNLIEKDIITKIKDNKDKVITILYIIIEYMNNANLKKAYTFFLNAFNNNDYFDYCMIFFTRYLIYEYIKINENKFYSIDNDIKIGTLLPKAYCEENIYSFPDFYKKHLLKMKVYAEKLDIYIVPFVFNCILNIRNLDYILDNGHVTQFNETNIETIKCGLDNAVEINLLYSNQHYIIFYKKDYYKNFDKYLDVFYNITDTLILNKNKENGKNKNNCLICTKNTQDIFYRECPCKCRICTDKCLDEYIKLKNNNKETKEKIVGEYYDHIKYCPKCEYENKKNDIKTIVIGDESLEDEHIENEHYWEIIENHWKWKCNLCEKNESFNRRFRYYRLIFDENDLFTHKKLEHLVCFQCYHNKVKNNKNKNKNIYCHFCEKEHTINCIKGVSEDNENESSCNLF